MGLFSKKPENPNVLKKYSVLYLGGYPQNPKKTYNVEFCITKEAFTLISAVGDKKFEPITIPFDTVKAFTLAQRQVSTAEGLLGGLDSRQLNQANNIHITCIPDNLELTIRLEMITGVTVMGQAAKCLEMMDFLKSNGILGLFTPSSQSSMSADSTSSTADEILKFKSLLDAGVLTQEEFDKKKQQLLNI